jgi:hypothetical protein
MRAWQRLRRRAKSGLVLGRELQCLHQPTGGVAIRVRIAALQLLDAVQAQSGAFGQGFLSQTGRQPVLSEQVRKRGSRDFGHPPILRPTSARTGSQ